MTTPDEDRKLSEYARRLRWALAALPDADRNDIVEEMRSHVLDRIETGVSMKDALEALGEPTVYASRFCEAYSVASALSKRRTPNLVVALAGFVTRNIAAAVAAFFVVLAWAVATLLTFVAILKIKDPAHVGLWRGADFLFIGIINDPSTGQELLGLWITPLAAISIVLAWLVTRGLATWALQRLMPRA
jgi:uncharacterized membrane protein